MSDPDRWREGDAPDGAADLLRQARRSRPMTPGERSRVAMRVDRIAALPVAVGLALWLKGIALAAGLTAAGLVIARVAAPVDPAPPAPPAPGAATSAALPAAATRSDASASSSTPAPAPPLPDDAPPPAPQRDPALQAPPPGAPAPPSAQLEAPPAPSEPDAENTLAREAALLEEARQMLASRPAEALSRLEQHAASFPRGKLAPEREILIVDALRRLGRTAEARARGEAILAGSRGGLYEERVRKMLESMP